MAEERRTFGQNYMDGGFSDTKCRSDGTPNYYGMPDNGEVYTLSAGLLKPCLSSSRRSFFSV